MSNEWTPESIGAVQWRGDNINEVIAKAGPDAVFFRAGTLRVGENFKQSKRVLIGSWISPSGLWIITNVKGK